MAVAKKKTTATKAATGANKAPAAKKKAPARKPSAPRKTAQTIRNLRGTVVHARLFSVDPEKPFRIALNPRGASGDTTIVPAALINDDTFVKGVGVLWEVITATEAKALEYGPVGYLGRTDAATIIRPEDTTVATADDWDGKGRLPQQREVKRTERGKQASEREFGTGMHTEDVPGSDQALHQLLKAGQDALPAEVDLSSRRVVVERVKGE